MTQGKFLVFSYGTLQDLFPNCIKTEASLQGNFILNSDNIFPELKFSENISTVEGFLISLTSDQLKIADEFESHLYTRQILIIDTKFGQTLAWVYIFDN